MPSLIYIQWGIIGFFVGIHFLLGFFRGASKSTYFTVVHLIMTIVTLWLVSIFTVRWFINSPDSIASVLNLVKQYTGFELDDQIITAITTPEVFGLILWFVDIVIKIIAYYTLYPVVKSILTLLIFRPIWKHAILKPMLARQHLKKQEAMAYQYHQQQLPAHALGKPSKKLKKSFLGRFVGAFVGGIRGAVIAFVFLLPILVIVSFSSNVYAGLDLDQKASHTELGTNLAVTDGLPSGVVDILEMIDELNEKSLFKFTQNITINNQTFDRFIFDRVFSSTIKVEEETIKISLGNELEQFLGVGLTVLESGYLDDGFDPSDISEDDLANVEQVFTYLGRSDLIHYIIPAAARYGVSSLIPEMLDGIRLDEREASSEALELFYQISWDDELGNIYGVLEAALQFRSVGEWQTLITSPELIAELSPEEAALLSNIFRRIGDIQTLTLLNVAIDYLTTLDDVQKQITWIAQEDREDYLQDRFAFILDNPEFFVGEESDFYQIALLIDTIFSEEFGETHLSDIYDNLGQIDQLIDLQNPQWVSQIIDDIVGIKLFIESVPFGVDFAFYTQLATDLDEEMTDRIISELELINWRNEISNVKDIYVEVLKLGVGVVFGDNPDYFAIVDDLALNHMDSIRTIVDYIFEGSEVVNIAIELAVPYFLDDLIDDPDLHNLLIEIMYSDPASDLLDFNFGLEVKNILNIVEVIYQFTTIEEVLELQGSDNEEILTVVSNMGFLETEEFERLSQAFYDLQILSRAGQPGLNYLKTTLDIPYLYVPQTVELNKDIQAILNLVYETAKYLSINSETAATLSEIDFTALLKDENYRAYFLSTPANKHSNLLFTNIAYNLQYWSAEEAVEDFIHIPTLLETAAIESVAWKEEVNHLLTAIFDFAVFVGESPSLSLSLDHLTTIAANPLSISIEVLTQLNDLQVVEKAFGNMDASYIFRSSFVNLFNTYGEQFKDSLMGYALQVPEHLTEDDMLKEDVFVNFIHGIMTLVADLNETLAFSTFEDAMNFRDFNELATAFNQAEDASIRAFGSAKLIHGIISEIILNSDYQQVGRDAFNNLQLLNITVDESFLNLSRPNNLLDEDEFSDLLISIKALQLSPDLVSNLQTGLFTYINDLEEIQLDKFFASYLLRELLDQVIANDAILDGIVGYVQDLYGTIQSSQALLSNLNPNFSHIIKSLPSYKDQDGFFDTDEFKAWILAFKELELASMDELKALSNLETAHQKIAASFVVETLFESRWIFSLANDAFTSETTLNQLADLATTQAQRLANSNYTFTAADVSLTAAKYGVIDPVTEKIKVSEIKNFLLAGTRLNWLDLGLGGGLSLAGNLSQELMATGYDSERHIDIILNSKIVLGLFDKVLNFEYNNYPIDEIVIGFANERLQGVDALSGLTLEPSILHYDVRAYDNNNVIRKEEIIEMVEAVTYIDLSGSINVDTFYQMIVEDTFKELFDSKIIHSWISNALNNAAIQSFGVDKANELQSFIVVPADFLAIDPILMDGDLFKVDEIENIIIALHELGLTNSQSFNQLGVSTFTNLLGRNIDPITHEDDFDRVLKAGYVYILLDRTLKLNSIGDFVADKLGGAIGVHIDHIDTTPSPAMLGDNTKPPIEEGRLPKQEFRNILISLDLLGDINAISLNRFMDMVDPYEDEDDFTIFMNSDYIYTIVARLLDHQAFGDYIGDQLAAGFADDPISLDMSVPTDAQGQAGVEEDLMKKAELRRLMISFKLVDFDGGAQISVGNIFGMIDRNVDPITQKDDYHRFLESIYIQDKMSQLLLSDAVIEIIANGRFDPVDFVMPASSVVHVDGRDRLIPQELYDLLYGLHLLGIQDFDQVDVDMDALVDLTEAEEDQLLTSTYLYVTIDLMLKNDANLNLPNDALEIDGNYIGMIKKTEIKGLINAFKVLGVTDPNQIDINTMTIAEFTELLDLDVRTIDQVISDGVEDNLTTTPTKAYENHIHRITRDELYKLVDTLMIFSDQDDTVFLGDLMPVDVNTITNQKLQDIHLLDSRLIDRITSEAIIDSGLSIHSLVYDDDSEVDVDTNQKLDIKRTEIKAMLDAIAILDIPIDQLDLVDGTVLTPAKLEDLLDLNSLMVYRLVSENIIDQGLETDASLAEVGIDANYDPEAPGADIKVEEMYALVEAMDVMGLVTLDVIAVDNPTTAQVQQLHYLGLAIDPVDEKYQSTIIHRLLSDAIIQTLDIPDAAYMPGSMNLDLEVDEISALIEAMGVMGINELDNVEFDNPTTAQVQELHYLGLAIDPVDDKYQSTIIHRLLSDAIIQTLDIPDAAYMPGSMNLDLEVDEISALIEAMGVMGINELDNVEFDNPTTAQVQSLHYLGLAIDPIDDKYQSTIIHRLLSDSIIQTLDIPDDAYMAGSVKDLEVDEISALIEAMGVMGINELDNVEFDNPTKAQVQELHYLGLAIDPIEEKYQSTIIHRLLSDSIIQTLDVPDDAYMAGSIKDLEVDEISALIDAMTVMNINDLDDLEFNNPTNAQIQELHYLGLAIDPVDDKYQSTIIHRLLSDSMIQALDVPAAAYMPGSLKDLEVDEISAVIDAMNVMNIVDLDDVEFVNPTRAQVQELHYLGLAVDPVEDKYQSTIIHRLLSDSIIQTLDIPDGAYMIGSVKDLEVDEISALIEAMVIMDIDELDDVEFDNPTKAQIQELHYLGLAVDPIDDKYQSTIVHRLLSESVILAVSVPTEAYMPGSAKDLKIEEISHILVTMDVLNIGTIEDVQGNINVPNLKTLTPANIETLVEATTNGPNVIVYYLIADVVDPANNLYDLIGAPDPDSYYELDGGLRVRLLRTSIADALDQLP